MPTLTQVLQFFYVSFKNKLGKVVGVDSFTNTSYIV